MKLVTLVFNREFEPWAMPSWCGDELRRTFPDVDVVVLDSRERIYEEVADADVLYTAHISERLFRAASRLRWIHAPMAGMDYLLIPAVVESDILVTNSSGVHAPAMAEHTIGIMLSFSRRFHDCLHAQWEGRWKRDEIYRTVPSFDELAGKTVGILGFGAIGREVARRARPFGMRIIGIRRDTSKDTELADRLCRPEELDHVLPELDFLVIAVPGMADTVGMIGRSELDRMKPTAVLINLARGSIVDQDALIDALNSGRLAGAGLDVFDPEPLEDGHLLFRTRNLLLTPHVSGISPMLWRRQIDLFIKNIRRFRDGRPLLNLIDKQRGY